MFKLTGAKSYRQLHNDTDITDSWNAPLLGGSWFYYEVTFSDPGEGGLGLFAEDEDCVVVWDSKTKSWVPILRKPIDGSS